MSESPQVHGVAHELKDPPSEILAGWIVECQCGWTNYRRPAQTAHAAIAQFAVHERSAGTG